MDEECHADTKPRMSTTQTKCLYIDIAYYLHARIQKFSLVDEWRV